MKKPVTARLPLLVTWSLLATPLLAPPFAHGESTTPRIETVTVSATRTTRPTFTTPAAVSTLQREDFLVDQPFGFTDVLESVPGVAVQGGPRRIAEEPAIRGFRDEQIILRLDGTRQNFNKAHGGRFFVDPDQLRSIEVLRGAGSAMYGSGALGGVMVMETLSGRDLTQGANGAGLRLRGGHQNNGGEWQGNGSLYGATERWDAVLNMGYRDMREDLQDGRGRDILASRDTLRSGMLRLGFEPAEFSRIDLTLDRFENTGRNPTNANERATATNLVDRDTRREGIRLRLRHDDPARRWLALDTSVYQNRTDTNERRLLDARIDQSEFITTGFELANTITLNTGLSEPARITLGAEAYRDEQSGLRNGAGRPQFPDADVDYRAVYAQAEVPLGGQVTLIPGLRFDRFQYAANGLSDARSEQEWTPRLALGWQPHERWYLWAEAAQAFRAPSLTELYADGVHFTVPLGPGQVVVNEFVATPNLAPEQARQWQGGLRYRNPDFWRGAAQLEWELTGFDSRVDNYVDQFVTFISGPPRFDPRTASLVFPGITSNRNIDARLRGAEASVAVRNNRGYLQAALSWVDGEEQGGGELASVQPNRLVLGAGFFARQGQLLIGSQAVFAQDRRNVPEGTLATAGYGKLDLFIKYSVARGSWSGTELTLAVDNVFDKHYRLHPNAIHQAGRAIRLNIGSDFQWF